MENCISECFLANQKIQVLKGTGGKWEHIQVQERKN